MRLIKERGYKIEPGGVYTLINVIFKNGLTRQKTLQYSKPFEHIKQPLILSSQENNYHIVGESLWM
jgi:hypothetical protein